MHLYDYSVFRRARQLATSTDNDPPLHHIDDAFGIKHGSVHIKAVTEGKTMTRATKWTGGEGR